MTCQLHNRRTSKDIYSNYFGISKPPCKNDKRHSSKVSNNICGKNLKTCSQNLQERQNVLNKPIKPKSCKKHNKNKKLSAIYNCQLNCKHCAYLACNDCAFDHEHCDSAAEISEEAAALNMSQCDRKHCVNDTNSTEETPQPNLTPPGDLKSCHSHTSNGVKTKSNGVIPHADYKHHRNTGDNAKNVTKSKHSLPHTDCKYCRSNRYNLEEVTKLKSSLPHTDCKYCRNNGEAKLKHPLPHTDCKYCLNNINNVEESEISSVNTDSISLEELSDELLHLRSLTGHRRACSLHDPHSMLDPMHLYNSYCELHHRRPTSHTCGLCEYPEYCLVNNDTTSRLREYITGQYSQSLHEFSIQNTEKSTKFRPCEFCLKNSGNPVIFNSHQMRNSVGTITCPILRHNICHECEAGGNLETYPEMPYRETVNYNVPCGLLGLHNTSNDLYSSGSSFEVPCSYSFQNMSGFHGNGGPCTNFNNDFCSVDRHFEEKCTPEPYLSFPTLDQCDSKSSFFKYNQNYNSKLKHKSMFANIGKSKRNVFCQFCLTTGKPPYIYNSHELRDESGVHIKCPILKDRVNTPGGMLHPCNSPLHNTYERDMRFPLTKEMSNGRLSKYQYFDLLNCLV